MKKDDEEVFNDDELARLFDHLKAKPDILHLGIILMFCTGVRVGELVAMKWCDITDNAIKIRRTEISYRNSDSHKPLKQQDF